MQREDVVGGYDKQHRSYVRAQPLAHGPDRLCRSHARRDLFCALARYRTTRYTLRSDVALRLSTYSRKLDSAHPHSFANESTKPDGGRSGAGHAELVGEFRLDVCVETH